MSKLKEPMLLSLPLKSGEESKSAKDMSMGFAAIVVNGDLFDWPPKPKSMFIALSVAVVCGRVSSKRFKTAGSERLRQHDVQSII